MLGVFCCDAGGPHCVWAASDCAAVKAGEPNAGVEPTLDAAEEVLPPLLLLPPGPIASLRRSPCAGEAHAEVCAEDCADSAGLGGQGPGLK